MTDQRLGYLAYLLRLWQVSEGEKTIWRASLENAHTSERKGFINLDDLFRFLRQQTDTAPGAGESKSGPESTHESEY